MAFLDIFNDDAFSMVSMTDAINTVPTVPSEINRSGLFKTQGIYTEKVAIEQRDKELYLIPTSPRGAPYEQQAKGKRNIRDFSTVRIAKEVTIRASELAHVRMFGKETQVRMIQEAIAEHWQQDGGLIDQVHATWENMYLGAIQGRLLDADASSTLIYDFFNEFGITQNAEFTFDLATLKDGAFREAVQVAKRTMMKKFRGARVKRIVAWCSEGFWDALHKNPEFRETFIASQKADDLRNEYDEDVVKFGGIYWKLYNGSDDVGVKVPDNKGVFTFEGAGFYKMIHSPGESFSDLGKKGKPLYSRVNWDKENDEWVKVRVSSYPLAMMNRPDVIFTCGMN